MNVFFLQLWEKLGENNLEFFKKLNDDWENVKISLQIADTEGSCLMQLLTSKKVQLAKNRIRKMTALTKLIVHKNCIRQIFSNGFEKPK